MAKDDKLKALDAAIAQIEKTVRKRFSYEAWRFSSANMNVETVPTGSIKS